MGPHLSIIFLFFAIIIGNIQCTDIQLDEYIRDMKNLKADFDNVRNYPVVGRFLELDIF